MASLAEAEDALRSTSAKANFQRLTRLLMCGGLRLLRETLDFIHSPADLPLRLGDPTIQTQLRGARLTQPEWNCLYPSPGVYGKSTDFDITLTFRLLRTICNLTPPPGPRGWDNLPNSSDHSLEADLVRIKYYRNEVYGHSKTMEVTNTEFSDLWGKISEALVRIAAAISHEKKDEWKKSIDDYRHKPLTPAEDRYIEQLNKWYKEDMDVKTEVEKLREEIKTMKEDMKKGFAKQPQRHPSATINMVVNIAESTTRTGSSGWPQIPQESGESQGVCAIPVPGQGGMDDVSVGEERHLRDSPTKLSIWTVILSFKKSVELLFQYLGYTLGAFVRNHGLSSLLITVECSSLQTLQVLWEDYRSGHLNAIAQEILVTVEVLKKLGLDDVRLKTFISEEEYEKGKQIFVDHSAISEQSRLPPEDAAGKSASQVEAGKDAVSEFVLGYVPGEPIQKGKETSDESEILDYLERISKLEKENRELKRRVYTMEIECQDLQRENIELRRERFDAAVKEKLEDIKKSRKIDELAKKNLELEKGLVASENARESSDIELKQLKQEVYSIKRTARLTREVFPHSSASSGALASRRFRSRRRKRVCQVIVMRQELEALDEEKIKFESVFKDLGFYVDKEVCESNDDLGRVLHSVHGEDNLFVCFVQSSVTGPWSFIKLLHKFKMLRQEMTKIIIIQGHRPTTALEAGVSYDYNWQLLIENSFTDGLQAFGEDFLCLFVPYRKGYISTLLSVIKLPGSKQRDILDILSEAKKLFYEKSPITIPEPVHNLTGPVYLN